MAEPRELRVLLVMYDLPKWLLSISIRYSMARRIPPRTMAYFDDWIRVQQSVLLVLTHLEPAAFTGSIFAIMVVNSSIGKDPAQAINDVQSSAHMFVLDARLTTQAPA